MKKRLLFVIPAFNIGGTVVSTINLINLLEEKGYDISILSLNKYGEMSYLYKDVKQIKLPLWASTIYSNSWREDKSWLIRLTALLIRVLCKINVLRAFLIDCAAKSAIKASDFDAVIACQESAATEFVSYSKAKNKIAWVRCDYSRYMGMINKDETSIYENFKKIVCVSDATAESFVNIFPQLKERTYAIKNPQSDKYIINQSKVDDLDSRFKTDKFTIVSVGRFDPVKRFEQIPTIASFLIENNVDFRWYIIGGGSGSVEQELITNINKEKVAENVICLGIKTNPLFYIKKSELLVTLSSSEACPRVINEAKILSTPVVCTDFSTAKEYIESGKDGIIDTIDNIKYSILDIIKNKNLYNNIKTNISKFEFDNSALMNSIEKLLNDN
ncbi:MAG: glycosyltransferase [Muribaculaceae bacterium]|nr:glycosyltransferase [Muribaculaceae bacterium]